VEDDLYLRWMWPRRIVDIVKARAAFDAARVPTRIANLLIYGLGVGDPAELRDMSWEDTAEGPGLKSRLEATRGVGPKIVDIVRRLQLGDPTVLRPPRN
jgi:hypothetical protein